MGEKYKFVSHKECEYFPCHKTDKPEEFSCLFCYCPLYALGRECGGNYNYLPNGIKDCSACLVPHKKDNFEYVTGKLMELYKELQEKEIADHPDLYK